MMQNRASEIAGLTGPAVNRYYRPGYGGMRGDIARTSQEWYDHYRKQVAEGRIDSIAGADWQMANAEDENYKRRVAEGYRSMQGMVADNRCADMIAAYGPDRTLAFAAHERAKAAIAGRRAVAAEHEGIFGRERKPEPTDYAYDHPLTLFDRIRAKIHARNP